MKRLPYCFILFAAMGLSHAVQAHAKIVKTQPEKEATLQQAPERVEVWFNEGVGKKYTALAVIQVLEGDDDSKKPKYKRIDKDDAQLNSSDPSHLTVSLPPIQPGKYIVRYRAQSADGHIVSGKYSFTLKH